MNNTINISDFAIKKETEKSYGVAAVFYDKTNESSKKIESLIFFPKSKIKNNEIEKGFFDFIVEKKIETVPMGIRIGNVGIKFLSKSDVPSEKKYVNINDFSIKTETEKSFGIEAYFFDPTNEDSKSISTILFVPKSKINENSLIEENFLNWICQEKIKDAPISEEQNIDIFLVKK